MFVWMNDMDNDVLRFNGYELHAMPDSSAAEVKHGCSGTNHKH